MPVSWRRRLARRLRGWALALDPPQPRNFYFGTDGSLTGEPRNAPNVWADRAA